MSCPSGLTCLGWFRSDAVEQVAPMNNRQWPVESAHEKIARILAPALALCRRLLQLPNAGDQAFNVTNGYGAPAISIAQEPWYLAGGVADKYHGAARGRNPIEFAGYDETLELGAQ